ncbi:hypothetical protein M427DRAFT_71707 [Gonapodya prolifera JEL478]|uniref:Uncharacterized protein n=1 Tax=Gonapodya prolifera (strain JEL478) TaxID=1344416 RepID=A0A139A828_GONPJ|nr:hypothetical protein M427DRAFT_71707 [Gonapodya prolifera JEL478]|eukprot:KXS12952.1 hypothetical protein M427DRAFT_71707 [Gonapodya prolifera JEL478]
MSGAELSNFADEGDITTSLQIYVNAITLASFVAQLVILVTFIPDLAVFPMNLKVLSLCTIVFGMLSPLVGFVSHNYSCNPGIQAGCTLFLLGTLGKWFTYTLRIWLLSLRRHLILIIFVVFTVVASAASFESYCAVTTGVRVLPRLCGPETLPGWTITDSLSTWMCAGQNFFFAILHVYYLRDYFTEIFSSTEADNKGGLGAPMTNRFAATLSMCAGSILVMIVDGMQFLIRRLFSSDPVKYFIIVFGSQILSDIIYCAYMRRFAAELYRETQITAFPYPAVGGGGSGNGRHYPPVHSPGGVDYGVDYVTLREMGGKNATMHVPVEYPSPIPSGSSLTLASRSSSGKVY